MLERFKRSSDDGGIHRTGGVATADPADETAVRHHDTTAEERTARREWREQERTREPVSGPATASALEVARARQREQFGGINWGASFFGWLVTIGVATLLTALLASAGASIGLTVTEDAVRSTEEIGLLGGIALLAALIVAYYAGGYVAGRMSRFDGARQGMATWAIGLAATVALAVVGVVLGDEYNVLDGLNLPAVPVGDQSWATGAVIAFAAILIGTAIAAVAGGKVGERYHRRVDRAGFTD